MIATIDLQLDSVSADVIPISRTKPFNPTAFIGAGYSFWRGPADGNGLEGEPEQDNRSLAMTEVDLSKILLESHLNSDEICTTGDERIKRIVAARQVRVDLGVLQTLWDNKERIPRRFKEKINGNTALIFCEGQVLRGPGGVRVTLGICFIDGSGWRCRLDRFSNGRQAHHPSAVVLA